MTDHDDLGFIADALPAFLSEAREQIASIEQLLLQLEDAPEDRELLAGLQRDLHTLKGGAEGRDIRWGCGHDVLSL